MRPPAPDSARREPPEERHRAKKSFGQHFLHDGSVIARIVRAIDPKPDDTLVEIGPGLGALTGPLLQRCPIMHAVELDRDVIPRLLANLGQPAGLKIHLADALAFDFASLAGPDKTLRLVGNLPYNISTPLLFHLLAYTGRIRDMHFMLQKEVVDRIVAAPGSKDYGRLTVAIAAKAEAVSLFDVGPDAFSPPPKVDSAVVRLRPRPPAFAIDDPALFDLIVKTAFGQRRKQLGNVLRGLLSSAEIESAGVAPSARAETLSPAQFGDLTTVALMARAKASQSL